MDRQDVVVLGAAGTVFLVLFIIGCFADWHATFVTLGFVLACGALVVGAFVLWSWIAGVALA